MFQMATNCQVQVFMGTQMWMVLQINLSLMEIQTPIVALHFIQV